MMPSPEQASAVLPDVEAEAARVAGTLLSGRLANRLRTCVKTLV